MSVDFAAQVLARTALLSLEHTAPLQGAASCNRGCACTPKLLMQVTKCTKSTSQVTLALTTKLPLQETQELQAEKVELEAEGRRGSNVSEQPDTLPQYNSEDGQPAGGGEVVWCSQATSRLLCATGRQGSALWSC